MKLTTRQFIHSEHPVTCRNCQNHFTGNICNKCGEKVFNDHQLSAKHFFHQIIDFFTHYESKVLKTIWLNFTKPGFITAQNLKGIRVPYANPIQLYLVVSILFYFTVTKVHVKDYTPSYGDQGYYGLSGYRFFRWAEPFDNAILNGIDKMQQGHFIDTRTKILDRFENLKDSVTGLYPVRVQSQPDTAFLTRHQLEVMAGNVSEKLFLKSFDSTISAYSKTFIFILLPLMACLIFLFFYKELKFYGAALIFSAHFMVFNLCFFILHCLIDWLPAQIWGEAYGQILSRPIFPLFEGSLAKYFNLFFVSSFEFFHLLFWVPWLFLAFRRLTNKPWWANLIISFICGKVFYYLIFSLFKKALIAFTIWTMH